jgi:DNA-binding NarL/FixJ family response regulator
VSEAGGRIRILLADDHAITREGTRRLLELEADFQVVAEAADGREAVDLTRRHRPDVLILDVSMPVLSGIQVAHTVREELPDTRIVVLTGYDNDQYALALLRLGVSGYLSKAASSRELVGALRRVYAGETCFQPGVAGLVRPEGMVGAEETLTPRELEVLRLVAEGQRNREIAKCLVVSERTIQFHLSQLFAKLDASSRTEVVHRARQRGWIG